MIVLFRDVCCGVCARRGGSCGRPSRLRENRQLDGLVECWGVRKTVVRPKPIENANFVADREKSSGGTQRKQRTCRIQGYKDLNYSPVRLTKFVETNLGN